MESINPVPLRNPLKNLLANLGTALLISFLIILPFLVMELVNRQEFRAAGRESFPFPLFFTLWLVAAVFMLILLPVVRRARAGDDFLVKPVSLLVRIALLGLLAWHWGSYVVDQMPCFLGVMFCD